MNLKGIMKSLNAKPGQVVPNPYVRAFAPQVTEGEDHEVSMAQGSLEAIAKHTNELLQKIGQTEKDIPAWIQDHIAKAENYIQQANGQYHEYGKDTIAEIADADGNLKIKKKYDTFSEYEKNAKVGDYLYFLRKSSDLANFEKSSRHALYKVVDIDPNKNAVLVNYKRHNRHTATGEDTQKTPVIVVAEGTIKEAIGDTYVVFVIEGSKPRKVKVVAGKSYAQRILNMLSNDPKIEGAGFVKASEWGTHGLDESADVKGYSLGSAYLGNGLTYYNREVQDASGDYKKVAHIEKNGKITFFDTALPSNLKKFLQMQADMLKRGVRPEAV